MSSKCGVQRFNVFLCQTNHVANVLKLLFGMGSRVLVYVCECLYWVYMYLYMCTNILNEFTCISIYTNRLQANMYLEWVYKQLYRRTQNRLLCISICLRVFIGMGLCELVQANMYLEQVYVYQYMFTSIYVLMGLHIFVYIYKVYVCICICK